MFLRLLTTVAACCTLLPAVLADDLAFSDFVETAVIGSVSLDNAKMLPLLPVSAITAGKLTVTLEKTRLDDVQATFGGTVRNDGEGGNGITWLCYATVDATLWFSAFTDDGSVTQVTVDADTSHAAASGCGPAPAGLTTIDYGIPGIGAPLADLTARFGKVDDDVGLYSYISDVAAPESPDFTIRQFIVVTAPAGAISAITVGQATIS